MNTKVQEIKPNQSTQTEPTSTEPNSKVLKNQYIPTAEFYSQVIKSLEDYSIFTLDNELLVNSWSSGSTKLFQYETEEVIGKHFDILFTEEDKKNEIPKGEIANALKDGSAKDNRWHIRKDGSKFYAYGLVYPLTGIGGERLGYVKIVRDNTDKKNAEDAIIQSELKFRGLMERYNDAIVMVDKYGAIEFVNKQFKKFFGYESEEIIGKLLEELMPERFRMKHIGHRMQYMAHPTARPMGLGLELYGLRKDGSEFPVDISLVPFDTNEGMVFSAFIRDLSDRKRYESQQKFLADTSIVLQENIDFDLRLVKMANLITPFLADFCMIFISENNQLVSKVNIHSKKLLEETLALVAANLFSRPEISPYRAEGKTDSLKPLLIEDVSDSFLQTLTIDEKHLEDFKKILPKSLLFVPLVAREKIIGAVILGMSSSKRKFSEVDILFVRLVEYRIALSIDNIRLYDEAQRAIYAREDILSIVSHDLRNPLAAIKGGFQLIPQLLKGKNEEQINTLVSTLGDSATFMERLINDLLDFSKIHQGNLSLQLKEISIEKLISEIIELSQGKAKEKSIDLSSTITENASTLICDPDRIKQVLNNLIGNAIKFTPENGKITLGIQEQAEKFYFSVIDNGPGISKENLLHIFDRYWQVKKTAHLGTGLGLFIAKGLVEAHGGGMWLESEIGKGSNFQFEIPKIINSK